MKKTSRLQSFLFYFFSLAALGFGTAGLVQYGLGVLGERNTVPWLKTLTATEDRFNMFYEAFREYVVPYCATTDRALFVHLGLFAAGCLMLFVFLVARLRKAEEEL